MKCPHCERCFMVDVTDPNLVPPDPDKMIAAGQMLDDIISPDYGSNLIEIADSLQMEGYRLKKEGAR